MYKLIKENVCRANLELAKQNLVILNWGNVSEIDRENEIIAIKPSGVGYDKLVPEMIVVLDFEGNVIEGDLRPSTDTATHLELYKSFDLIGAVCHVHSVYATAWSQAKRQIPCYGTTHADTFYGTIPITKDMTEFQIKSGYEINTGKVIVERFEKINPMEMPAVLVAGHGPFAWGKDADGAVKNAVILEEVAKMAYMTEQLVPGQNPISQFLLDKHFLRKHGSNAYYGQSPEQNPGTG